MTKTLELFIVKGCVLHALFLVGLFQFTFLPSKRKSACGVGTINNSITGWWSAICLNIVRQREWENSKT